jgi:probable DNA metabolism protein
MKNSKVLQYDGSFNGFLTVLYTAFDKGWNIVEINKQGSRQDELFTNIEYIKTNTVLAKKVWFGLERKSKSATKIIYFSFLSEQKDIELSLFKYVHFILSKQGHDDTTEIETLIENLNTLVAKVEKEKRRMEVFANFQLSESDTSKALLKPKYNVLPLLSRHLRLAQRDKQWEVFDTKRNYGISYIMGKLEISSGNTSVRQAV